MTPSPWLKGPFTRPSNRAMGSPFDAPTSRPLSSQIAAIFAGGAPGLWAEAGNAISTPWYQDSVGSTPVTAVGQTLGLMLDKRLGLVLGPELVSNPGPFTTTAGWAAPSGSAPLTVSGGRLLATPLTTAQSRADIPFSTSIGKWYSLTVDMAQFSGAGVTLALLTSRGGGFVPGTAVYGLGLTTVKFIATTTSVYLTFGSNVSTVGVPNILTSASVRELPGNHLLQATAPARPLLSARVNLLTKTEDFADAAWTKVNSPAITPGVSDPLGGNAATTVTAAAVTYLFQVASAGPQGTTNTPSVWIRRRTGVGPITLRLGSVDTPITVTSSWAQVAPTGSSVGANDWVLSIAIAGDAIDLFRPQLETGPVATRYQRVNTATDYDTAGFLHYDKFDGIDDGLSTAPFAAGTLTSNMDCFVLMRRDSAAQSMLTYPAAGGASYLGAMDATAGAVSNGAGTPTFWVNGVAVPGGTATTRTQLAAAIPVGSWAVVEIRNANLSAWTALGFGGYTSFPLNAGVAAKLFCPAQSDAMRTTIRQYLAKKAGITL